MQVILPSAFLREHLMVTESESVIKYTLAVYPRPLIATTKDQITTIMNTTVSDGYEYSLYLSNLSFLKTSR